MKLLPFLSLLHFVHFLPAQAAKLPLSRPGRLFDKVARELSVRDDGAAAPPRMILYTQNRATVNGTPLSLLPLLEHKTGATHVIVSSFHVNSKPGDISLNDDPPSSPKYDSLWKEVKVLQANGIKVMAMLGGAAGGTYSKKTLGGNDTVFQTFYQPLVTLLRYYNFDGIDLDIEEFIDKEVPLRLLKALRRDMDPSFILTMAPVALALQYNDGINLSGFNYFDLDSNATDASGKPLVEWYNAQFYSAWGDASSPDNYRAIMKKGWKPERVIFGVLTNSNDGFGFVEINSLVDTIKQLRKEFPGFGGVYGWDYFDAGMAEVDGGTEPWQWVQKIRDSLYAILTKRGWMKS